MSVIAPVGGGVLRISSDRDHRRIFGDLKFLILGFFSGGKILAGSQNPNPISDQKCHFSNPFPDLAPKK